MQAVKVLHCSVQRTETLPPWVIEYWKRVTPVLAARSKYAQAEAFLLYDPLLQMNDRDGGLTEATVMQETLDLVYRLGWEDVTAGFKEGQYAHELMPYASGEWLQTLHINYHLELIKLKLSRAGVRGVVMASSFFLAKVFHAYKNREKGQYEISNDFRFVRKFGTLIAQTEDDLFSIGNVDDDHWVPFIIAPGTSIVHFADSIKKGKSMHAAFKKAMAWWLEQHFARLFDWKIMRITEQHDGSSCGILAGNCLEHHYLGDKVPLALEGLRGAKIARLEVLSQILRQHYVGPFSKITFALLIMNALPDMPSRGRREIPFGKPGR